MGTETWSPEVPGLLSHNTMAKCGFVFLLLAISAHALAEDVQELREDVPLSDELKALMLARKEDLLLNNLKPRQRSAFPPGEYALSFGDAGSFTSPNFPADYPNDAKAKWIFRCIGGVIETSCFTRIRTSPGCRKDQLALFTGKGFNGGTRYCGRNDALLGTYNNRLKAVFKSDGSIKNKGFDCEISCSAA